MTDAEPRKIPQCETTEVFDSLERVSAAIARADSSDEMLASVLDELLDIFGCDRAWLAYPCKVEAESWRIPMERTRPQWPGGGEQVLAEPVDDFVRGAIGLCLASDSPVSFGPDHNPLGIEPEFFKTHNIRSQLFMAIYPAGDDPWVLGIHHCAAPRQYGEAQTLFRAIGRRVADGMTALTDRHQLRQSEERFRTIVEHAPEAIVIMDLDLGCFIDANPMACTLFQLSREEFVSGMSPIDLSPELQPDGRPSAEGAVEVIEAAARGAFPTFEWMHQSARGKPIPCEVRLAVLPHPTRRLLRGSMTDISERKRAEEHRAELEARLAQAQKMEAIGQLTGGIAHDFNNLLTVILGYLELVSDQPASSEIVLPLVGKAHAAALRASDLTQRLLAFARRQPLRPTVVNAGNLLRNMEDLLRRTLGEDIELELLVADDLWNCEVDEPQFQNVILNLALNARDAMPEGGRLSIEACNAELTANDLERGTEVWEGPHVLVAVTDSGAGISGENLEQIFTPFYTTKEVGKGSGLGLAMVYGFVKQSGGHIRATSEVGVGTSMRIYVPRVMHDSQVSQRGVDGLEEATDHDAGEGECILVVEDAEEVRALTRTMLEQLGYEVLDAEASRAALAILEDHPRISLLLSDVRLPGGMNGAELARAALELRPELHVLYMSGYTEKALIHEGRLDADIELLEKPFTRQQLARRVREALDL